MSNGQERDSGREEQEFEDWEVLQRAFQGIAKKLGLSPEEVEAAWWNFGERVEPDSAIKEKVDSEFDVAYREAASNLGYAPGVFSKDFEAKARAMGLPKSALHTLDSAVRAYAAGKSEEDWLLKVWRIAHQSRAERLRTIAKLLESGIWPWPREPDETKRGEGF